MSFFKGCGAYLRILTLLASSKTFSEMQTHAHAARAHRENCQKCISLNRPLVEQFFGKCVIVVQEEK